MYIDKTFISKESKPYVISEIGLNHNGIYDEAIGLIEDSKEAGCQAVKFQIRSEAFFDSNIQTLEIGQQYVYEYVKATYLNFEHYTKLINFSRSLGLDVLVSCWDLKSLNFANKNGIKTLKIASADLTNELLISKSLDLFDNLVISTGMSSQKEIESSVNFILKKCKNICVLHCSSTYPAPINTLNLKYISRLSNIFPELIIGYSGHELEYHICLNAQSYGANVFEKHITRNKEAIGNDHKVSLLKEEMKDLIKMLNDGFQSIGNIEDRVVQPGEKMNRVSLSKSLCLKEDKKCGYKITFNDLDFTYGGRGIAPNNYKIIINKTLLNRKDKNEVLEINDFKEFYKEDNLNLYPIKNCTLGIPVRYHDALILYKEIRSEFLEFHLSYKDLDSSLESIKKLFMELNYSADHTFHAPDFYANDLIFDPFSNNSKISEKSNFEFIRFLEHVKSIYKLYEKKSSKKTKIIVSFSCSNLKSIFDKDFKDTLYERLINYLINLKETYPEFEILPQTLPVHAWYLGGRRFVNIFADPREILNFCNKSDFKICLDTAHTIMACNFYELDSSYWLNKLIKFTNHIHLVDAKGDMDEGLNFGDGELNLCEFTKEMKKIGNLSYIPEIWQGHHNRGEGFKKAINKVNDLIK